jgi:superfamily II DNA helicase RecQ
MGTLSLENRRIEMSHANTDAESKERILTEFTKPDGIVQVLVSTVAFGMGINIPDVDIVIHWGLPTSCLRF